MANTDDINLDAASRAELRARVRGLELENFRLEQQREALLWEVAASRAYAKCLTRALRRRVDPKRQAE